MTEIAVQNEPTSLPPDLLQEMEHLKEKAVSYIRRSRADNTLRAYRSDWNHFSMWCQKFNWRPLPATEEMVSLYITAMVDAGYKASTIGRHLVAINFAHESANLPRPGGETLSSVWKGIRNEIGTAQEGKEPTLIEDIRRMVSTFGDDLVGLRNRTLLLVGFAGGFRRSELVSINKEDIRVTRDGLEVTLRRSKTDQDGEGRKIGIPYGTRIQTCPVRNLTDWMDKAGIHTGAVFRRFNKNRAVLNSRLSSQTVALIVKEAAANAGLSPDLYAGHSLRSGLATQATKGGASEAVRPRNAVV